jgi:hypothetical protein
MAVDISATTASMTATASSTSVTIPIVNDFQDALYRTDLENVFFNTDEFAETVSYYHSYLGTWHSYAIIWDDPGASADLVGDTEFNTLRPQFQISESVLAHRILKQDKMRRRGKTYIVEDFVSDGVGVTTVYLRIK